RRTRVARRAVGAPRHGLQGRRRGDCRRPGVHALRPRSESGRVVHARRVPHRRRAGAAPADRARVLRADREASTDGRERMTPSFPLIVWLIVAAVLTAGGMAVRSVSRIWLRHWAERQLRGAAAAVTYLERPHRLLTAANIGVALTLLIAGLFLGAAEHGA